MAAVNDPAAVAVQAKDLPVFCPNPGMPLWSSHPRVFLELDERGEVRCPYCGTLYRLEGRAPAAHNPGVVPAKAGT